MSCTHLVMGYFVWYACMSFTMKALAVAASGLHCSGIKCMVIWGYVAAAATAAGSARREAVSRLPSQPWENKMSAVSIAPQVFQPLSSRLANPACGEQYTQWDTKRRSAPRAQSVRQHYCVHFLEKCFFLVH